MGILKQYNGQNYSLFNNLMREQTTSDARTNNKFSPLHQYPLSSLPLSTKSLSDDGSCSPASFSTSLTSKDWAICKERGFEASYVLPAVWNLR